MRLTFSTLACPKWSIDQMLAAAVENRIGGIDFRGVGEQLDITQLPAFTTDLAATVSRFQAAGVEMPCFNTSIKLCEPRPGEWEKSLAECTRYTQVAKATHTPYLRVFGGHIPNLINREQAITLLRRHLRQLHRITGSAGVRVLIETHDDWSTSGELLPVLTDLDPAEAGVLWDVEHPFNRGEPPAETVERLGGWIAHVHVKDTRRVPGEPKSQQVFLGEGDLPLNDCINLLTARGYNGWYSLETEKRWQPDAPDPEQSIPQFAQYMHARA